MSVAKHIENPLIACLGLAFKANIDDLRESPALEIVVELSQRKLGKILVVEPNIDSLPDRLLGQEDLKMTDVDAALSVADIVLVLVDHKEFMTVNVESIDNKIIIDTRGIF